MRLLLWAVHVPDLLNFRWEDRSLYIQVQCGDTRVTHKVDEKINSICAWAERHPGRKSQVKTVSAQAPREDSSWPHQSYLWAELFESAFAMQRIIHPCHTCCRRACPFTRRGNDRTGLELVATRRSDCSGSSGTPPYICLESSLYV